MWDEACPSLVGSKVIEKKRFLGNDNDIAQVLTVIDDDRGMLPMRDGVRRLTAKMNGLAGYVASDADGFYSVEPVSDFRDSLVGQRAVYVPNELTAEPGCFIILRGRRAEECPDGRGAITLWDGKACREADPKNVCVIHEIPGQNPLYTPETILPKPSPTSPLRAR